MEWLLCEVAPVWSGSCVEWLLCGVAPVWSGSCVEWLLCGVAPVWSGSCVEWLLCGVVDLMFSFLFGCILCPDCAQLVEDQKEVEMLASSVFRRTLGVLKKSQSVLKVKDVKKTVFQRLREEQKQLKEVKGSFVREAQQYLFPLEVESVTLDDEGESECSYVF